MRMGLKTQEGAFLATKFSRCSDLYMSSREGRIVVVAFVIGRCIYYILRGRFAMV